MESLIQVKRLLDNVDSLPLSKIIIDMLPIALECKDYIGYCALSQLETPMVNIPSKYKVQLMTIGRPLLLHGLSEEEVKKVILDGVKEATELKALTQEGVSLRSVGEVEAWLKKSKETIDAGSYDTSCEVYQEASSRITQMQRMYETIRGYVTAKLMYYQQFFVLQAKISTNQSVQSFDMEKVFIVHGHNGELKQAVARLVERQGLQAIILQEQTNPSATIIENFERHSDVGCAICLFTADDYGRAKGDTEDRLRARQNVVFETGYFAGKLGRDRVILIADRNIEIPSDLNGVLYAERSNWQFEVLKGLRRIGYNIDYNKLD